MLALGKVARVRAESLGPIAKSEPRAIPAVAYVAAASRVAGTLNQDLLLTTAMGESTSDYLVYHINPYIAVVLGGIGLAIALIVQFPARRYVPWIYWLVETWS